jgi:hypothetical protein
VNPLSAGGQRQVTTQALFVDLPNFYSRLLSSGIDDPQLLKHYFLYWFDFDRLAEKLTGEFSPVWVFYSGRRFGPSSHRIQDKYLDNFIARINSLRGVTARDANIPGRQREPASYKCDQCGNEGIAQWESEKGIDASLTVYLFDTMGSWDSAYLLSGDADFVPVVASLRRRGKIIIGAGFSDASSFLVRECYDYVDLSEIFLKDDLATFKIFKEDGVLKKWLTDEIKPKSGHSIRPEPIELTFEWQFHYTDFMPERTHLLSMKDISNRGPYYLIYLLVPVSIDLSSRHQQIEEFKVNYPNHVGEMDSARGRYQLIISPLGWTGVERRLEAFTSSLNVSQEYEGRSSGRGYTVKYQYDPSTTKYEIVKKKHLI